MGERAGSVPDRERLTQERQRRRVESQVGRYMEEEGLWPADGGIVVGVSGGPDSSALLLVLVSLAQRRHLAITAAYFDHRLRGAAAAKVEREAVARVAKRAGAGLVCGAGDVRAVAREHRLGLEEAARRARYDFLATAARDAGCRCVAAGHTAGDQAETVLMHILRGAGLTGIAGIAPRSRWPSAGNDDLVLVRPLLRTTRAETLAVCRAAGIEPADDASNRSPAFLRNRVRNDLLPVLRQYNANVDLALLRLADAARADVAFIESEAGDAVARTADGVALDRVLLEVWPRALRRHAFRAGVLALLADLQGFGERHWRALDAAVDGPTGASLNLPRGVSARVERARIELRLGPVPAPADPFPAVTLPVPGRARFGPWLVAAGPRALPNAVARAEVNAASCGDALTVRGRKPGDRFQPLGLDGTKKLQDLFVDAHVPRAERDSVAVFEGPGGIVWVGGLRIAESARPQEEGGSVRLSVAVAT